MLDKCGIVTEISLRQATHLESVQFANISPCEQPAEQEARQNRGLAHKNV